MNELWVEIVPRGDKSLESMNTKINVQLLLKVADQISKQPQQFLMSQWDCGTAACIGGWACRLAGIRLGHNETSAGNQTIARLILCLSDDQSDDLFHLRFWPQKFWFLGSDTRADRAAKAVKRIHAFLDEHAPGWRDEHNL